MQCADEVGGGEVDVPLFEEAPTLANPLGNPYCRLLAHADAAQEGNLTFRSDVIPTDDDLPDDLVECLYQVNEQYEY